MLEKPSLKHFADYFVIGLRLNLCLKSEIIIWADSLIEIIDYPAHWMIDLSTSLPKNKKDIIAILNSVSGIQNAEISFSLLIAKLALIKPNIHLKNNRFFTAEDSKLFSRLYFMIVEYENMPDDIRGKIFEIYINMDYVEQKYLDSSTVKQDYQSLLSAGKNYQSFVKKNY